MMPQELIAVFHDTQRMLSRNPAYCQQTLRAQAAAQLYLEGYSSPLRQHKGKIAAEVIETTTFECAKDSLSRGARVAVLNFANPREPGGGVLRGAMAQEECLCRCSNLYNTLAQPYFMKHYYQYHTEHCGTSFSDRLIYSPDVLVVKSDDPLPQPLRRPFTVDVITSAAPYMRPHASPSAQEVLPLYESRIRNILEAAMAHDVDVLILGAFGCGAFHNRPEVMAKAFAALLIQGQYAQHFKKVKFAIKRSGEFCPSLNSFQEAFSRPLQTGTPPSSGSNLF